MYSNYHGNKNVSYSVRVPYMKTRLTSPDSFEIICIQAVW